MPINHLITLRIKLCMAVMVLGLAASGITAFPIEAELNTLTNCKSIPPFMHQWLLIIYNAIINTNKSYPYLSYGTDWLAFAHIMLAILFIGPFKNPVKNIWVIEFGIIACIAIFPLAFIAGSIRHIPIFWRLIDCSFGVVGILPLTIAHRLVKRLNLKPAPAHYGRV